MNTKILCVLAYEGEKLIGFKLGYARDSEQFYSWLGGVLPEYHKLGVASELMRQQHDWCAKNQFKKISTKSSNQFSSMIRLNLKYGFKIVGTTTDDDGKVKIIFVKHF